MNRVPKSSRRRTSGAAAIGVGVILSCAGCDSRPPAAAAPPAPSSRTAEATPDRSPDAPPVTDADLTPPDATSLTVLRTSDAGLPVIACRIADQRYELELAISNTARNRGFGGRDRFPTGTGMLFVHGDDLVRRYWMKDCLIPMDIVFIDRQGSIVAMHRMRTQPPRGDRESLADYHARLPGYSSRRPARYALEIPAGDIKVLGLQVGGTVPIPRAALDDLAARELLGGTGR